MASFRVYLTPAQAEAVRSHVNKLAIELQETEGKAATKGKPLP